MAIGPWIGDSGCGGFVPIKGILCGMKYKHTCFHLLSNRAGVKQTSAFKRHDPDQSYLTEIGEIACINHAASKRRSDIRDSVISQSRACASVVLFCAKGISEATTLNGNTSAHV